MATPVEIEFVSDPSKAVRAFDNVSKAADNAGRRFDNAAERTDNLDTKAAGATGSLGALSSGFELVGLDKYATGLQSAAMATDFFSGVGQGLTLILESQALTKLKDTAATVANTVATKTASVATKVWTAGQWLLNAALSANPIGLVVIAVVALIAIVVLLVKKNETVRRALVATWDALKRAAGAVFGWIADKVSAVWTTIQTVTRRVWDDITSSVQDVVKRVPELLGKVKDKVLGVFVGAPRWLYSAGQDIIRGLIDGAGSLLSRLGEFFLDKVPGPLKGAFKSAMGIGSPSRVFRQYGRDTIDGLAIGLRDNAALARVQRAATEMRRRVESGAAFTTTGPTAATVLASQAPAAPSGVQTIRLELTAQALSQIERGRQVALDIKAYVGAGGRVVLAQ